MRRTTITLSLNVALGFKVKGFRGRPRWRVGESPAAGRPGTIKLMAGDERDRDRRDAATTTARPAFARPAGPADEARLRQLREQALVDLGPARGGAMYVERHAAELPTLIADWSTASRRVWLGGLEGAALGYLLGAVVTLPSGLSVGVIEGIYVESEARGCGIGEAMLTVALDWFRSHGCVGVEATALPGERATKNFFEDHGLKARLLTVYRSFTEPDPAGAERGS
jgi:GNAT superfamily N-acetyltransferase